MKKATLWILALATALPLQAQSLSECQLMAEQNYPLVKRYDLVRQTTDLTIDNIDKGWLPQISASGQATLQNATPKFPEALGSMMSQTGTEMKGVSKAQYRVGVDVNQRVYDGGAIKSQKDVARAQSQVQLASTDVELYGLRQRVNALYFGILLIDEKLKQNDEMQRVLRTNADILGKMVKGGTAAEADYNSVQAELLTTRQQRTDLEAQRTSLIRVLSAFTGTDINKVTKPTEVLTTDSCARPELKLIDAQLKLIDVQEQALDARLQPQVSLFANTFVGYPGYNTFHDMTSRNMTFNAMVGARITWNIGVLYTRKNDKALLATQRLMAENDRDKFLFNNRLQTVQENEDIARYRSLMQEDDKIIALRHKVRMATESQLRHGIVDVTKLVQQISNENNAAILKALHETQMLQQMWDKKVTLSN